MPAGFTHTHGGQPSFDDLLPLILAGLARGLERAQRDKFLVAITGPAHARLLVALSGEETLQFCVQPSDPASTTS